MISALKDVDGRVMPARYSLQRLQAEAERLFNAGLASGASVESDGSGLTVEVDNPDQAAKNSNNPYVVKYVQSVDSVSTAATRQNDSSAAPGWKAGGRIRSLHCSTGYGFRTDGNDYLLTAAHCGASGVTATDGAGDTIGTTSGRDVYDDRMRIRVSAAAGRQFDKQWNNSTGLYKNVVGTVSSADNTYVCTSGSFTGVNCDIKITDPNYLFTLDGDGIIRWGVRAVRQNASLRAVGFGDSGGPVLKNTSVLADIRAAGGISGGQVEVACGSSSASTLCHNKLLYIKIGDLLDGGTLRTN